MSKEINYEALSKRLHNALRVAKKLGLEIIPGGGYAMDYDINRLPPYPVGLFGALSIIEGPGARSKLDLTYLQTSALEAGFNSVKHFDSPVSMPPSKKIKKDVTYLKLEALGKELAKKIVPNSPPRKTGPSKKKMRMPSYPSGSGSRWVSSPTRVFTRVNDGTSVQQASVPMQFQVQLDAAPVLASPPPEAPVESINWDAMLTDDRPPEGIMLRPSEVRTYESWGSRPRIVAQPNNNQFGNINLVLGEEVMDDETFDDDEEASP